MQSPLFLLCLVLTCTSSLDYAEAGRLRAMGENSLEASWEIIEQEDSLIIFTVLAPTRGFVGLGLSTGGGMAGADIFVGGVSNDGIPYLEDRHAIGQSMPILDDEQNLILLDAWENNTHTYIKFSRKLQTCDSNDVEITADTLHLIWSYGPTDNFSYHGGTNRGSRTVNLLDKQGPKDPDISMFGVWELRTNKSMPNDDTTYWCTIHKTPELLGKSHIVAFDAILESPDAYIHTHHMEAYLCHVPPGMEAVFDAYLNHPGDDCYYPTDSVFPGHYCESIAYGWAIGGEAVLFPDHLGFPMYSGEYFKLEVHYNNPGQLDNVSFDTGLKLYYTNELRLLDAGRLVIGSEVNFTQMIPPDSTQFTTVAHCDVSCTSIIPENGVALFNFLIHAHLSGRRMKLRQFRNGVELPWLINDRYYDFNFQATRAFQREMRLMPGDQLALECEYDSTWKKGLSTIGGRSTTDEMCMAFVSYYPRVEGLLNCGSEVKKEEMLNFFGIQEISLTHPSDTDPIIEAPVYNKGKRFSEFAGSLDWSEQFRRIYQNFTRYNEHAGICRSSMNEMSVTYPKNLKEYVPPDVCNNRKRFKFH